MLAFRLQNKGFLLVEFPYKTMSIYIQYDKLCKLIVHIILKRQNNIVVMLYQNKASERSSSNFKSLFTFINSEVMYLVLVACFTCQMC